MAALAGGMAICEVGILLCCKRLTNIWPRNQVHWTGRDVVYSGQCYF